MFGSKKTKNNDAENVSFVLDTSEQTGNDKALCCSTMSQVVNFCEKSVHHDKQTGDFYSTDY